MLFEKFFIVFDVVPSNIQIAPNPLDQFNFNMLICKKNERCLQILGLHEKQLTRKTAYTGNLYSADLTDS